MRRLHLLGFVAVVVLAVALAAACGNDAEDGGGNGERIRVAKGLSVAALAGGASGDDMAKPALEEEAATRDSRSAAPAASGLGWGEFGFPAAPLQQQGTTGLTVQGYGSATISADSAVLELYFGRNSYEDKPVPMPEPAPEGRTVPGGAGSSSGVAIEVAPAAPAGDADFQLQEVQPITEADLQPVIDAIVAQGVPRDAIEFMAQPYYDPYFSSATLRVTLTGTGAVEGVLQAARDATSGLSGITLQSTNVAYTVNDCAALERAAMQAAVEDANERAAAFAQTLGVSLGPVIGAANYSYAPFGGAPCGSNFFGPYPLGFSYAEGQSPEVQLVANVSITYAIQ